MVKKELSLFETVYRHPLLKKADYEEIARSHVQIELPSGSMLLATGKIAKEFYVVQTGLIRSYLYDYNGNEITTEFYGVDDIVIESFSLFHRSPAKENFEAITDAVVWKIGYDSFQQLLQKAEGLREWGRAWSTNQLFLQKQRFIDLLTVRATDRYLTLIKEKPQIIEQSPLKYIASYLGVTDTSLSRIRKEIISG